MPRTACCQVSGTPSSHLQAAHTMVSRAILAGYKVSAMKHEKPTSQAKRNLLALSQDYVFCSFAGADDYKSANLETSAMAKPLNMSRECKQR